jgi:hypothetical protein
VVPEEVISSTSWGNVVRDRIVQVFDSVADRNASAVPRQGMVAWSIAEGNLALYMDGTNGWVTVTETWKPWTPTVFSGPTTIWALIANNGSQYRRRFGQCEIFMDVTVLMSATSDTDLIRVLTPVPTSVSATFGVSFMRDSVGTYGPYAQCDTSAQEIATAQLGAATLVHRSDLAASGNFDWHVSGTYPTGYAA